MVLSHVIPVVADEYCTLDSVEIRELIDKVGIIGEQTNFQIQLYRTFPGALALHSAAFCFLFQER